MSAARAASLALALVVAGAGCSASPAPDVATASGTTPTTTGGTTSTTGAGGSGAFALRSSAFVDGGTMPVVYSCDGEGRSPPFAWVGAPAATVELALVMSTLANDGMRWNWVLYAIPGETTALAEDTDVGTCGLTSDGPLLAYYPPCSQGPGPKDYTFTLYALSQAPSFAVPPEGVTAPLLEDAIAGTTLDLATLTVSYTRQ